MVRIRIGIAIVIALQFTATLCRAQETPASDPLAGLGHSILSGDPREARTKIAGELAAARKRNDVPRQAVTALLLGLADIALESIASARPYLEESVRLFESSKDHFGSWLALCTIADLEKSETRYDAAVVAYERAVGVLTRAALPGETLSIAQLEPLGSFAGIDESLLRHLDLPPEIIKPILLAFLEVPTRDGYGSALIEAGQLERAEAELTKARVSASLMAGLFDERIAAHFGDLRRRQWRFDEARREYLTALRGGLAIPMFAQQEEIARIGILGKLADIELLAGRVDAALAWNDQALERSRASADPLLTASVLHERGVLLYRARRFDVAQAALEEAGKIAEDCADPVMHAEILFGLGTLNLTRGRHGTAASQFEKAAELFHHANDPNGESNALMFLSSVYWTMDMTGHATMAMEKARDLAGEGGFAPSQLMVELFSTVQRFLRKEASLEELNVALARMWSSPVAQRQLWSKDGPAAVSQFLNDPTAAASAGIAAVPTEARPFFASLARMVEARDLIQRNEFAAAREVLQSGLAVSPEGEARTGFYALLAGAWDGEGNTAKATEYLLAAAKTLELTLDDVRVEEMLTSYLGVWNIYFDALIETFLKQGRIADAFNVSERARARAFLQLIGNHRIQPGRGADAALVREAEALRTRIAEWESMPASATTRNVRNDLREAQSRYTALLTRLKLSSSEYAALTTIRLATAAEIQSELPPGTALVSYYATRSGLHVWVLDRSAIHHVRLHAGAATLAQAACWAERIGRRRGVTPAGDPGCAQVSPEDLHRELFAPLEDMIATSRLVIVPHGALHYVPFAALRNGRTGRYLIEDFTLMYAPSASALRFMRGKESPVDGTAMVLGDPGERLPFAQREAIQVAAALRISPLLGGRAMESRFYGLDGMTDLVHVAAHGTYDADHPLFSRISLAAGEGRDGNLEVHEILGEVDLSGVNLVVLAACDTGVGKSSRGDDVVGFTRAFLYAGTPGVLAALWKIPDDATAALMEEFYCLLLAGDSAADALRGAQLALLRGERFTRPEQWAAFALYGDPRGRWASASPAAGNTRSPQDGQ